MKARLYSLPFLLLIAAACFNQKPALKTAPAVTRKMATADQLTTDVLNYTNLEREKKHLKPLVMKEALNTIAKGHSDNMASKKVPFSHDGFKDRYAMARAKLKDVYSFGENVSYGPRSGKEAVDSWMDSPPHKANILGDFTSIGIGIAVNPNGTHYFTQVFCKE